MQEFSATFVTTREPPMNDTLPDKILVVDDDPTVCQSVVDMLAKQNIKVLVANDLHTALYHFNQNRLEVVLVELDFEPNPGLVMIQKWRRHEILDKRATGFILLTGNRNSQKSFDVSLANELRDIDTLAKPFTAPQLLSLLAKSKATRSQVIKFDEVRENAFKLSKDPTKVDKAIEMVQKQIPALGPRGMEILVDLYEMQGRIDEALKAVESILEKDQALGWLNRKGRLLMKIGKHAEALKLMEVCDKEAPGNIERINNLAQIYLSTKQPDKATQKMLELIELHPENPDLRFELFNNLYEHGFDTHAQDLCKKTTTPLEVVRYYNNKGVALSKTGNVDGALTEYERSLQYYPKFKENYRIYFNIALAHASFKKKENYELASEYIDKCLALKPDFEKAQKTKETIDRILGKTTKVS